MPFEYCRGSWTLVEYLKQLVTLNVQLVENLKQLGTLIV